MIDLMIEPNPSLFLVFKENHIHIRIMKNKECLSNCFKVDGYILLINTTLNEKFPQFGTIWNKYGVDAAELEFVNYHGAMIYFVDEDSINIRFKFNKKDYERLLRKFDD